VTQDVQAFYLPAPGGQRLCIHHRPSARARASVVYVHPFAEEMNKARRMAALQARCLAQAGCAVLQIDLTGCGDSSGEFGSATWQGWVDDVVRAAQWLRQQSDAPLWLWGLRAGCLLCVAAAPRLGPDCNFLFWQPASSGQLLLQQFLRLKIAGDRLAGKDKGSTAELRVALERGDPVEIAGYWIGAELARGLEQATLSPPKAAGRLECLELSTRPEAALSPATTALLDQWHAAGHVAQGRVVEGPAFWQTVEIEEAPALLAATRELLVPEAAP